MHGFRQISQNLIQFHGQYPCELLDGFPTGERCQCGTIYDGVPHPVQAQRTWADLEIWGLPTGFQLARNGDFFLGGSEEVAQFLSCQATAERWICGPLDR